MSSTLSAAGHRLKPWSSKYLLHANTGFRYCSTPVCLSVSSTSSLSGKCRDMSPFCSPKRFLRHFIQQNGDCPPRFALSGQTLIRVATDSGRDPSRYRLAVPACGNSENLNGNPVLGTVKVAVFIVGDRIIWLKLTDLGHTPYPRAPELRSCARCY
jgi:hypothetical protein